MADDSAKQGQADEENYSCNKILLKFFHQLHIQFERCIFSVKKLVTIPGSNVFKEVEKILM